MYASATFSGFLVFHRSCATLTFCSAVSAVNGGTIGAIWVSTGWMWFEICCGEGRASKSQMHEC